ncbi:MAG: NAD(P)H-quinone oxidoreductase [Rubrivivax sp.]|nr:MAG: NAD(P)H-quinone oxidoreductase [Rubrivivax sp.]
MPMPSQMNHIAFSAPGGPDVLHLATAVVPQPASGELLLRVEAAGVNRPDVLQRSGHYPVPPGASQFLGLEVAGEVIAVGSEETNGFKVGDRVCALTNGGGYATHVTVPATQALPWPKGYDAIQAAALPETFFTVWANLFQMGRLQAGETVLLHGGGSGIGTTATQLAHEFGARPLVTVGSEAKREACTRLGAQLVINHREQDFQQAVADFTQGKGVNAILDIMGAAYFTRNLASLAQDGRLLLLAFIGGTTVKDVNLAQIMAKRLVITGSAMRPRTTEEKAGIARELKARVWPVLDAGRCAPLIHAVFPLAKAADAHRLMESSDHIGKIVLQVGPPL